MTTTPIPVTPRPRRAAIRCPAWPSPYLAGGLVASMPVAPRIASPAFLIAARRWRQAIDHVTPWYAHDFFRHCGHHAPSQLLRAWL